MNNKILFAICLSLLALTACYDDEIEDVNKRLDNLENISIASINQQIAAINTSIGSLDKTDEELKSYITNLQTTATELQRSLNTTNEKMDRADQELQNSLTALRTEIQGKLDQINIAIGNLQTADVNLGLRIDQLRNYTDSEIGNTKDWASATFSTLEQYHQTVTEIAGIKANITAINTAISELETRVNNKIAGDIAQAVSTLEGELQQQAADITQAYQDAIATAKGDIEAAYTAAIRTAISNSESSLQSWVNAKLTGYYTIAETEAKLKVVEDGYKEGDEALSTEIATLRSNLETAKTDLTAAYQTAIATAIEQNNGVINAKMANDIATAETRLQQQIDAIITRLGSIESRLDTLEGTVSELINIVQSIVPIPDYQDGSVECNSDENDFYFEVQPSGAASRLAAAGEDIFSMKAVYTQTKSAISFIPMPISAVRADSDILIVTASGSGLNPMLWQGVNASLTVTSGTTSKTTGYFPLFFVSYEPEAVDLGLSVRWASFNIGENGFVSSPEEYGAYYAWGETEAKSDYSWDTYKYGRYKALTKYNTRSTNGIVDNKTVLEPEDDVAHVKLGGKWRMPTFKEWEELWTKCTLTWTTQNGINGCLVTAPNGKSIFLPAAGYSSGPEFPFGCYWSSSLFLSTESANDSIAALCFSFSQDITDIPYYFSSGRASGCSIRPVSPVAASVTLSQSSLTLLKGDTSTLIAKIDSKSVAERGVTWTSNKPDIAEVSSKGVVTAISAGKATITASCGGLNASCMVTVIPDASEPFTITSYGNTSVSINKKGNPYDITLEYRKGSDSWNAYTIGSTIDLKDGEFLQFRAGNERNTLFSKDLANCYRLYAGESGNIEVSGNIMSLLDIKLQRKAVPDYCFTYLFRDCYNLVKASNLILPATTLASHCYQYMFDGCSGLTSAPELPATTLASYCYCGMFDDCSGLTSTPELPATTLASFCYSNMFYGCSGLTSAPELPATTLASYCYSNMFYGCSGLTSAPELPATTLVSYCYSSMFQGCSGLTSAPELPATTLVSYCYSSMFQGCSGLTSAPELPATTLASYCYSGIFSYCSGLTSAPELPATTLASYCYQYMFNGCSGLTSAPELPATTLASHCYQYMFDGCSGLTSAPELPATTLASYCYSSMFQGCSGLTSAPELPATTLASYCYSGIFSYCSGLTSAPELPATTLASYCYSNMFYGCSGLTSAPELLAATLVSHCYDSMFARCKKLSYVKAMFTKIPSGGETNFIKDWLAGVSATGTFVKSKDATWDVTGSSGIPSGWTVITE